MEKKVKNKAAVHLGKLSAKSKTPEQRKNLAIKAATKRWKSHNDEVLRLVQERN